MIELQGVGLTFPATGRKHLAARTQQVNGAVGGFIVEGADGKSRIRALEDICFRLGPGDRLALLGHNGAGKTSLLRVVASVYPPSEGRIKTVGRVTPLLNLSFGMDQEATGRQNIFVRGLYLGLSRQEITRAFDSIVEFSELGRYLDMPVRTYSSGMRARLAFSVAVHVPSDALLIDETIATGDATFMAKAKERLVSCVEDAQIVILASHSNKVLTELCNLGLLLKHGRTICFGEVSEVVSTYKEMLRDPETFDRNLAAAPAFGVFRAPSRSALEPVGRVARSERVVRRTRVLLLNDTGRFPNPGCRAVRKGYKILFRDHLPYVTLAHSIPAGYWTDAFRSIAPSSRSLVISEGEFFARTSTIAPAVDTAEWEHIRQRLLGEDRSFRECIKEADIVLVNAEGSVHHNGPRAISVLALALSAAELGKPVLVLNATIQAMEQALLAAVLPKVRLIHSREPATNADLQACGYQSVLAPDIGVLGMGEASAPRIRLLDGSNHVLVTAGVLAQTAGLLDLFRTIRALGRRPCYLSIPDGGDGSRSQQTCDAADVPFVDATELGVKEMVGFLRQFSLVISGRHHINLFSLRSGVPILALPSNTWKIEATLAMLSYPLPISRTSSELQGALSLWEQRGDRLRVESERCFADAQQKMSPLIEALRQCI